ncbi:MAG: DUF4760 domain-containing protein [Candidatus Brocadiaceae bacterium]|nr:DUF4760 domain-containing protein [Candidatus Brocadiaceae bacterium]
MHAIFTAANITALISIINLVVITSAAILLYRQIKTNHEWNRLKAAHDLILDSNLGTFRTLRNNLEKKIDIYDQAQTYATSKGSLDKEDHRALEAILNYLDNLCLAIKNNVVDKEIAFNCLAAILLAYQRWASPYIQECRKGNPLFWIEIDQLVNEWAKRIEEMTAPKVSPRRPKL